MIDYNPTFIIEQDPTKFGSNQADYLARANKIINDNADKIRKAKKDNTDLKIVFREIIDDLSVKRSEIALAHKSRDAESFGLRRFSNNPGSWSYTFLHGVYKIYNDRVLGIFANALKKMEKQPNSGDFIKEYEVKSKSLDRLFTLKFEILDQDDIIKNNWQFFVDYIDFPDYFPSIDKSLPFSDKCEILKKQLIKFKQEKPNEFQRVKMCYFFNLLDKRYPPPRLKGPDSNLRSKFIRATLRVEIDGKLYPLTQYLTWLYKDWEWLNLKDPSHHPIERMNKYSCVLLMHQDELLVDKTIDEMSKVFEKIIKWDKSKDQTTDLKDQMALLMYLSAHNMRDVRGTSAETEWLERSIYKALDVQLIKDSKKMTDLEAFSNPLFSDFKEIHNQIVTIK